MINDAQTLIGAYEIGCLGDRHPIRTYDDGFGSLYIYRESCGIIGIVRAMSWEAAYECVLDEILQPIDEADVIEAYGCYAMPNQDRTAWYAMRGDGKKLATFDTEKEAHEYCLASIARDETELVEGYDYQPNASGTGIVSYDLNGNALDLLTQELAAELQIKIQIEEE